MNPFIPLNPADIVIIDGRVGQEMINNLKKMNIKTIIPTIKCREVEESISYHPDIVIHPIDHNTLVISPSVFDYYDKKLKGLGIKIIKGNTYLGRNYPSDIAYNVGRVGNIALHKILHTDKIVKNHLKSENIKLVNIKQGYSKCAIAIVDFNSAITSDKTIYNCLLGLGFDALLISAGHIILKGQKYGFIGGATGNFDRDTMLFSGSLDEHPDKNKIKNFIKQKGIEIIYLSKEKLIDIGTIICLNSK